MCAFRAGNGREQEGKSLHTGHHHAHICVKQSCCLDCVRYAPRAQRKNGEEDGVCMCGHVWISHHCPSSKVMYLLPLGTEARRRRRKSLRHQKVHFLLPVLYLAAKCPALEFSRREFISSPPGKQCPILSGFRR